MDHSQDGVLDPSVGRAGLYACGRCIRRCQVGFDITAAIRSLPRTDHHGNA